MKYQVEYLKKIYTEIDADNSFDADDIARKNCPQGFELNEYWRIYETEREIDDNRKSLHGNSIKGKGDKEGIRQKESYKVDEVQV